MIGKIGADVGGPTAKTCRSVISGVMGLAARRGAVLANPVREVEHIESKAKQARSLTDAELAAWLNALRADPRAVRKELPDLTLFMLSTGCRIGEALAVLWDQVDLATGTVQITHTVIRVRGEGLIRKWIKNRFDRALQLPLVAVAMLRRRFVPGTQLDRPVFPDSRGGFRDPSNTSRDIRLARGPAAMEWLTSHVYRKTTATVLDDAGMSARQVADQLGHARPSMTQDVYMGRRVLNPGAAEDLDGMLNKAASEGKL
nr:site-specific integrase [Jiangella asiatica]